MSEALSVQAATPSISLKDRAAQNLQNNKYQVIGSGTTASALVAAVVVAAVLGGPIGLIIGLAVAAFAATGLALKTTLAQPKNVEVLKIEEPKTAELVATTETVAAPAAELVPVVAAPVETAPAVETVAAQAPVVETVETPAQSAAPVATPNIARRVVNYVSSHPGKVALSAAALVAAGYGLYVGYGVYAAAAAAARLDAITNKLAGQCPVPRNGATKLDDVLNYFELNGCSNCTQTELNKLFSKAK